MYLTTQIFKSALIPVLILLPAPGPGISRDMARDIEQLQRAECEYRGITATFDELTRAYILQVYEGGQLLRWQAEPSPYNPETETLVTAVFTTQSPKEETGIAAVDRIRAESVAASGITWRYSTLAATRISAHGDFALDAIAVFQQTVDGFVDRMVYAHDEVVLLIESSPDAPVRTHVEPGVVLLVEEQRGDWLRVRRPSSPDSGWIQRNQIHYIDGQNGRSN